MSSVLIWITLCRRTEQTKGEEHACDEWEEDAQWKLKEMFFHNAYIIVRYGTYLYHCIGTIKAAVDTPAALNFPIRPYISYFRLIFHLFALCMSLTH